jgi:hypothetical protein
MENAALGFMTIPYLDWKRDIGHAFMTSEIWDGVHDVALADGTADDVVAFMYVEGHFAYQRADVRRPVRGAA